MIPEVGKLFSVYFNANSICNKRDELFGLLDGSYCEVCFDFIFICETWLGGHYNQGQWDHPSYDCIRRDRVDGKGGGLMIYVSKRFSFLSKNVNKIKGHEKFEILWIEIFLGKETLGDFVLVYRPPNVTTTYDEELIIGQTFGH